MPSESEVPRPVPAAAQPSNRRARDPRAYWRANLRLIFVLLAVWAVVSFGTLLAASWLNTVAIGHLPFGFWMAQQGAIYVFVVLIFVYARLMDGIDREHGVEEGRGTRDEGRGSRAEGTRVEGRGSRDGE